MIGIDRFGESAPAGQVAEALGLTVQAVTARRAGSRKARAAMNQSTNHQEHPNGPHSLRQLLDHAAENSYGVPAFNVNNLEQIQAIMEAAEETRSPVILQASAGARKYAGEPYLRHMVLAAVESCPNIPIVLHQDHGASPAVCMQSLRSGFTSVMMDGSLKEDPKTPASYEYNVDVTRAFGECRIASGSRSRGNWAAWVRWKPARRAKRTAWEPRGRSRMT